MLIQTIVTIYKTIKEYDKNVAKQLKRSLTIRIRLPETVSNKLLHKLNLKLMLTAELRSGCFATYNKAY